MTDRLPSPPVHNVQTSMGTAAYMPHSDQVIFYDKKGHDLFGYDWSRKYSWHVVGTVAIAPEIRFPLILEFYHHQKPLCSPETNKS